MTKVHYNPKYPISYADSAASDHCFINIEDFVTYRALEDTDGITAAEGGKFTIAGIGRVEKRAVFNGKIITLSFDGAMHCPSLSHNLISIGTLETKGGCFSVFGGGGVTLLTPDQTPFLRGKRVGTMYEVDLYPPTGTITPKKNTPADATSAAQAALSTAMAFAT
jgi:hypothetical protein